MATLNIPNPAAGAPVTGETANSINGVPVSDQFVERVILAEVTGHDVDGKAQIADVGSGGNNIATIAVPANVNPILLIALRANRRSLKILNDSLFDLLIIWNDPAPTVDNYAWKIPAGFGYEVPLPCPSQAVYGLWLDPGAIGVSGKARITEQY
jgi:hypothetical protein